MIQFDNSVKEILKNIDKSLLQTNSNVCSSVHMLHAILMTECFATEILNENNLFMNDVVKYLPEDINSAEESNTPLADVMILDAEEFAIKLNCKRLSSDHILLSILSYKYSLTNVIFDELGVDKNKVIYDILDTYIDNTYAKQLQNNIINLSVNEKNMSDEVSEYSLDELCINMIDEAKSGNYDKVIGRDKETDNIIQILSRKNKNNVCLVGEPGVGKTAIVENLALSIAENRVPYNIKDKIIYSLNVGSLIAGTKYRGEFEERLQDIIKEATSSDNIVLFIDELHTIMGAGAGESSLDAANILKPALARGNIQVIGATTYDEYMKHIEKDSALERRFTKLTVNEPSKEETINILKGIKSSYESYHNIEISDDVLSLCVDLSSRYITDRYFPDKAIDILDEACSRTNLEDIKFNDKNRKTRFEVHNNIIKNWKNIFKFEEDENQKTTLNSDTIYEIVANQCNISAEKLKINTNSYRNIDKKLSDKIIGQNDVINAVANSIKRASLGFNNLNRPVASFLFSGSSGVGKTYLAKILAFELFASDKNFITVDMSEYMQSHNTSKLIGSPPGYVGFENRGQLTEKIRKNPYSIILFDEIEKAHPDVLNILLRILDEGEITDSTGRNINFRNTIIIMTSNVGTDIITNKGTLGFSNNINTNANNKLILDTIKKHFKPEFINRIDEILVFNMLDDDSIKNIIKIKLNEFFNSLEERNNIKVKFNKNLVEYLFNKISDKNLGARPIERLLNTEVKNKLADFIINQKKGLTKINIQIKNDNIQFNIGDKNEKVNKN